MAKIKNTEDDVLVLMRKELAFQTEEKEKQENK